MEESPAERCIFGGQLENGPWRGEHPMGAAQWEDGEVCFAEKAQIHPGLDIGKGLGDFML